MKDYKAVDNYYKENQHTEFLMCHYLNKNMPLLMVERGIFFEIQVDNKYNKNDIILIQITPDREKKIITKVEYEFAATQTEWDFELPRDKWQALNLINRKKYGETFSLFIKSSTTFNSIFAIDCSDNFIQKNFGNIEKLKHSLNFETNDEFYRIYWNDVNKFQFVVNDNEKFIKNGEICIVEFNNWTNFYRFIWNRFIKTS
jgi:hypothetical protein